ncbi:bifunctional UDP-2,4-diacetamido-2,4,6-trideoxy-beta-L-altropyranose hydrolase/GNAT family N-acetyltransferase [Lewinella sp. W8]|uniref:GNAT family N-acetyltransferase n=1 Tax=Lewinella sp. W8 TaxID=2528208 RepID=UPI0010686F8F|nr:GNAT family N-acetyltransferase [Lewinella sp. W8]
MNVASRKPIIIFRADGNRSMGLGHLYRSAALASMLRSHFWCGLISFGAPVEVLERIKLNFDHVDQLGFGDKETFIRKLAEDEVLADGEIVVLDGYHFTTDLQESLAVVGKKVVCIDDVYRYHFTADVIINHSPSTDLSDKYSHEDKTALAFGLDFALLREPFLLAAREAAPVARSDRFYMCFGGADPQNISTLLLSRLSDLGFDNPVDVVLGASNPFLPEVRLAADQYPGPVKIHHNLGDEEMIGLYQGARLAFLPASTTMLEAIACKVPIVMGYAVDNQMDIYHGFLNTELFAGVGDWNKPQRLKAAIDQCLAEDRVTYGTKVDQLIDGYSNVNLSGIFKQLAAGVEPIVCRRATKIEMHQYFKWANDPVVRSTAVKTDVISWEEHTKWFSRRLVDQDSLLLFFLYRNRPCGQIRYEVSSSGSAIVSISIDPGFRGQRLASRMLAIGQEQFHSRFPEIPLIVAYIRPDNLASRKTFERVQFSLIEEVNLRGTDLLRYERRERSLSDKNDES